MPELKPIAEETIDLLRNIESKAFKKFLDLEGFGKLPELKVKYPEILFPNNNTPIEWWYFTGHTKQYGFEFCLFKFHPKSLRLGVIPLNLFRQKPFIVLHASITDKKRKTFRYFQDTGIVSPQHISKKGLTIQIDGALLQLKNKKFHIKLQDEFDLTLKPLKPMVKHYKNGYVQLTDEPMHDTYYVSFTRNEITGKIGRKKVKGLGWFDHQKANLPPSSPVKGWDWFSMILDNGEEVMLFMLRDKKGIRHDRLGGTIIDKKGKSTPIKPEKIKVKTLAKWKSEETGITYPQNWEIKIAEYSLKILPVMHNQEMDTMLTTPTTYWEGACEIIGKKGKQSVKGKGYAELVGYDNRLIAQFIRKSMT